VALKIAVPMMQKEFKWQGFSSDEIRLHLQSGRIMTFSSGEEFKMGPTIADCFLVDGAVIHSGELIGSPAIINHVQLSDGSAFDDGQEVEESVCAIPERAVLLVVKRKHEGKGIAIINNRTSMTSQLSKGMSTVRPRADVTHAGRAGPGTAQHKKRTQGEITRESRTSFNTVIVDTARREYMASKLANGGRAGGNIRAAPEALMEMTEDHFNTDEDEN